MRCGCALMLVLLLSFLVSVAAKPSTKVDRILREKRKTCDKSCEWKNEPERQICVYKCISPLCYEEVYMPDELEEVRLCAPIFLTRTFFHFMFSPLKVNLFSPRSTFAISNPLSLFANFLKIFGQGEIDVRAGRFNICYRREFKEKESQAEMSEKVVSKV